MTTANPDSIPEMLACCGYCGELILDGEPDEGLPSFSHESDGTPLCMGTDGSAFVAAVIMNQVSISDVPEGFLEVAS